MTTSPGRKILRKTGLIRDQKGIMNRYLSEGSHWDDHLANCKDFIVEAAAGKNRESVFVLGSGWLLDVPVEFLLHEFGRVYLVDLFHPPQIMHKFMGQGKVEFVNADLSGGMITTAYDFARGALSFPGLLDTPLKPFAYPGEPGLILSVNLLSQIDTLLVEYLERNVSLTGEEIIQFRRKVQEHHLSDLQPNRTCLVTDFEENFFAPDNETRKKSLLYTTLPPAKTEKEWNWEFDTTKTYRPGYKTTMRVKAIQF